MSLDRYSLVSSDDGLRFVFYSDGPNGLIRKVVSFKKIEADDEIYNLGFGDFDPDTERVNDLSVSNNRDRDKILATVAAATIYFSDLYPEAQIFAEGSTPARTRLYVMGVAKHLKEITNIFEIWGALGERKWELFRENKPYVALLAKRK